MINERLFGRFVKITNPSNYDDAQSISIYGSRLRVILSLRSLDFYIIQKLITSLNYIALRLFIRRVITDKDTRDTLEVMLANDLFNSVDVLHSLQNHVIESKDGVSNKVKEIKSSSLWLKGLRRER